MQCGIGNLSVIALTKSPKMYAPLQNALKALERHDRRFQLVRALVGALQGDGASKGFVTTTSNFAPRLFTDPLLAPLMPSRLELVDGVRLVQRLKVLAADRRHAGLEDIRPHSNI